MSPTALATSSGSGKDADPAAPGALSLRRLAHLLAAYSPQDGAFELRLPGTFAVRLSRMSTEPIYATVGPALCVVAQGAKVVMLGREMFEYNPARMLVFAVDLPVSGQVIRTSVNSPYLCFVLKLDSARIAELAARVFPDGLPKPPDDRGLYYAQATDASVEAITLLLELVAHPADADLLAPLGVDEILIRLLPTPIGS